MTAARLNPKVWTRTLILAVLLAWPVLLFGRPGYIADTLAYAKGGKVAVEFAIEKAFPKQPPVETTAPSISAPAETLADKELAGVNGARSAWYSVTAYLLSGPGLSFVFLAVAQILLTALTVALAIEAFGPLSRTEFGLTAVILAIATPLPFVASSAVPDIFAGLAMLSAIVLMTRFAGLSKGSIYVLCAILTYSVASHPSIPPLVASLLLAAGALWLWQRRSLERPGGWAMGAATIPFALGLAMTASAGMIAFGEVSAAPKRFPLALGRSISDGPARWYLEEECKTSRYAVCEVFGTDIPDTVSDFVFTGGLEERATPEQMDRIRAEEREIVMKAALRYPGTEFGTLARNIVRQMYSFANRMFWFDRTVYLASDGTPQLTDMSKDRASFFAVFNWIALGVAAASLASLSLRFRSLEAQDRNALLLVAGGIIANAIIVVVFSGIADRYQARIVWIVPLLAWLLVSFDRKLAERPQG